MTDPRYGGREGFLYIKGKTSLGTPGVVQSEHDLEPGHVRRAAGEEEGEKRSYC